MTHSTLMKSDMFRSPALSCITSTEQELLGRTGPDHSTYPPPRLLLSPPAILQVNLPGVLGLKESGQTLPQWDVFSAALWAGSYSNVGQG